MQPLEWEDPLGPVEAFAAFAERAARFVAASPEVHEDEAVRIVGGQRDVYAALYPKKDKRPLPPIPRALMRDPLDDLRDAEDHERKTAKPRPTVRYSIRIVDGRAVVISEKKEA